MNRRHALAVLIGLALTLLASLAFAQDANYPRILDAKPMYQARPAHLDLAPYAAIATLPQWKGSFTDLLKNKITYVMVGTDPSKTNVATTIPVDIIPIKVVYGINNGNHTFDPVKAKASNGVTIINNIIASPIFNPGLNFTQGGTNLGTTQYLDAFQRGNFWKSVHTHTGYHVLLGQPKVLAEQTISVPASLGGVFQNPFGSGIIGTYDINAFDAKLQGYIKKFTQINPGVLPLFVTYDVYLTDPIFGCCIGGYHSSNGLAPAGQTYSHATYENRIGSFAQDVSALSHEIGEWMDDPFPGNNNVACRDNGLLEVGDPLEGNANYGAYPYTLGGFTYNLQSLVFLGYFGAPKSTSVHSWLSFQHDEAHVCPGQ